MSLNEEDFNAPQNADKQTVLMCATKYADAKIMQQVLNVKDEEGNRRADINAQDINGDTALSIAVKTGDKKKILLLLTNDANVELAKKKVSGKACEKLEESVQQVKFAKRLKSLNGLTPWEFVIKKWKSNPKSFKMKPIPYKVGLNTHICMESTGCYSEGVAEFFHELGFKVSVVNPLQIKSFRNSKLIRQKTDSVDAQIIAEFCLQNAPAPWNPKSPEQKELHNLNVRISALKSELHRSSNALENENLSKVILKSIRDEIKFLKKQIDLLENESRKIINFNQKLKEQFDRKL